MNETGNAFESGGIKLHLGDCLEVMKGIPDGSVDAVICDLPYGILIDKRAPAVGWDFPIPAEALWTAYKRIVKPDGAILLFGQGMFTVRMIESNPGLWRYNLVWDKINRPSGFLNARVMPMRIHEEIMMFYKSKPTYNPQMTKGPFYQDKKGVTKTALYGGKALHTGRKSDERYPVSILRFKPDAKRSHPTQKPVALLEYLVKTYTNEGDTVLDNTMGSGSTMVACVNTKRKGIGIELMPEYYEIATRRVREAQAQLKLF